MRLRNFGLVWLCAVLAATGLTWGQQGPKPLTRGALPGAVNTTPLGLYANQNLAPLLPGLGQTTPVTSVYSFPNSSLAAVVGSSGQTGFSEPLAPTGTAYTFNRVQILCYAYQDSGLPTTWRLTISTSHSAGGTVLFDSHQMPIPAGMTHETAILLSVDFPTINQTSGQQLWANISADQGIEIQSTNGSNPVATDFWYSTSTTNVRMAPQTFSIDAGTNRNAAFQIYHVPVLYQSSTEWNANSSPQYTPLWMYNASTYSAWGTPMCNLSSISSGSLIPIQPFNRLTVGVSGWDTSVSPPLRVRARIKDSGSAVANTNGYTGTVIGDQTVTISPSYGASKNGQLVTITFPSGVYPNGHLLWLELFTDSHVSFFGFNTSSCPVPIAYGGARSATTSSITNTTLGTAQTPNNINLWWSTEWIDDTQTRLPASATTVTGMIQTLAAAMWAPTDLLPSNLYGVVGQQINLFYDPITGYPAMAHETDNSPAYTYEVICSKGVSWRDHWAYTPVSSDAGTSVALTITPSRGGVTYPSWTTTVNFVATAAGSTTRKLLYIGDSLVDAARMAQMQYCNSLYTGTTFSFQGANTGTNDTLSAARTSAPDSTGATQNINCESWPGENMKFFVTGTPTNGSYNSGAGPFVFSGSLNIATYLTNNSITLSSGDWVFIEDLYNDIAGAGPVTSLQTYINQYIGYLDTFIAAWQAAVPGIRIVVTGPFAAPGQNGNAYANGTSTYATAQRIRYGRDQAMAEMLAHYDTPAQQVNNVWVSGSYASVDPVNDFNYIAIPVSQYNSKTVLVPYNAPHPAFTGYYSAGSSDICLAKVKQ